MANSRGFKFPELPPPKRKPTEPLASEPLARRRLVAPQDTQPDWDHSVVDDEGGRFFGDGLTTEQREVLTFVEQVDPQREAEAGDLHPHAGSTAPSSTAIDATFLRRLLLQLEKAITKNQELRVKYPDTPARFMESEIALDQILYQFVDLAQAPQCYPDVVQLGIIPSLLSLLPHENTDIAGRIVQILNEWTDEDVPANAAMEGLGNPDDDDSSVDALIQRQERSLQFTEHVRALVRAIVEHQGLDLFVQNLVRLNPTNAEDQQTAFATLGFIENITTLDPQYAEVVVQRTKLVSWLLNQIQARPFNSNVQYASEILVILLQTSRRNRLRLGHLGGVDSLLQQLAQYRRQDPITDEELEYMENLFDALCSALTEPELKLLFLQSEGVELMTIMLRERRVSRSRALKVLNYAVSSNQPISRMMVERLLDASGLVPVLNVLMKKGLGKFKKTYKTFSESEEEEHTVCIVAALLKHTDPASVSRWRIMRKFLDHDCERVDRLVELHLNYTQRLRPVDEAITQERAELQANDTYDEDTEDNFYLRRMSSGLFTLQTVDTILVYLGTEDALITAHIERLLKRQGKTLDEVRANVQGKRVPFSKAN
ncbi:hypothetical protein H4R35_005987 [Dimargaris xerosporica]|nr:hypothetical protein H4R35_005987 [Dimargaris xerosporica]